MGTTIQGKDPFSDDVGHQNILACGPAGSGKTFLATSMPGKVAYLVVESQATDNIKQAFVHHGRKKGDIEIFEIRPQYDPSGPRRGKLLKNNHGKLLTPVQVVKDTCDYIVSNPQLGFTSIVLDSLTALQELEKFGLQEEKPTLSQRDWGDIIDDVTKMCTDFRDLKFNTMVIVTTTVLQDDENRMHHRISLFGKKLPTDLPRYFNLAVTMRRKRNNESGESSHEVLTSADNRYITKGHLALDPVEVPDVRVWFEKMNTFWSGHGTSQIPDEAGFYEPPPQTNSEEDKIEIRLESPQVKELFEKLGAPEPDKVNGVWDRKNSRVKAVLKYRNETKLIEQLTKRVAEKEVSA